MSLRRLLGAPEDHTEDRALIENWLLSFLSRKWGVSVERLVYSTPVVDILDGGGDKNDILGIYVQANQMFEIDAGVDISNIETVGDIVNHILKLYLARFSTPT